MDRKRDIGNPADWLPAPPAHNPAPPASAPVAEKPPASLPLRSPLRAKRKLPDRLDSQSSTSLPPPSQPKSALGETPEPSEPKAPEPNRVSMPSLSLRPAPMVTSLPSRSFSSLADDASIKLIQNELQVSPAVPEQPREPLPTPSAVARPAPAQNKPNFAPAPARGTLDLSELTAISRIGGEETEDDNFQPLPSPPLPSPYQRRAAEASPLRPPDPPFRSDFDNGAVLRRHTSGRSSPTPTEDFNRQLARGLGRILSFVRWRVARVPVRLWLALPARRTLLAMGIVGAICWGLADTPAIQWSSSRMSGLTQDLQARAAFQLIDDFTEGIGEHWVGEGLEPGPSGAIVRGLALNHDTMDRSGYRFDFEAKIMSRSLGWIVAAADERNYYAFKLEQIRSRGEDTHRLSRYQVVDGQPQEPEKVGVSAALPADEYARVSVRLRDSRITTFINGEGVDYLETGDTVRGGVGFFAGDRESAVVRRIEFSGNEDNWGLFLFGFIELLTDARDLVLPPETRSASVTEGGRNAGARAELRGQLAAAR